LQVTFRKRATKYRALLWKIDGKDKAFYDSTVVYRRKVIGSLVFSVLFPQKSPMISGSFAESDLQLMASYGSDVHTTACA